MKGYFLLLFILAILFISAGAPPGISEINEAKNMVRQDFRYLSISLSGIGGIFGILGGLRIYNNWQLGQKNIDAQVAGWIGSAIFLNIMAIFIKALYSM